MKYEEINRSKHADSIFVLMADDNVRTTVKKSTRDDISH
ncbi:uncharacterized protein RCO7_14075 [Rhynchosporium graminicola]|uniref:Uncharacterized protein n=1 Tax=Rhynchosporium graminicola TaxID=2792576 RepID=A0A1E1JQ74_9HELO|nr:uncharacterized protein RCO7_14075 [Rhynchosporium commune]